MTKHLIEMTQISEESKKPKNSKWYKPTTSKELKLSTKQQIQDDEALALQIAAEGVVSRVSPS